MTVWDDLKAKAKPAPSEAKEATGAPNATDTTGEEFPPSFDADEQGAAVNLYRSLNEGLAAIRTVTLQNVAPDQVPAVVVVRGRSDATANAAANFEQTFVQRCPNGEFAAVSTTRTDDSTVVSLSPTFASRAVFCKDKGEEPSWRVEVLESGGRLQLVMPLEGVAAIYSNDTFGVPQWYVGERFLAFIGEEKPAKAQSYWDEKPKSELVCANRKFDIVESWGEQLAKARAPRVFVIDLAARTLTKVQTPPRLSCGWLQWAGRSVLFSTWDEGDKLGLIYCQQRPSQLYTAVVLDEEGNMLACPTATSVEVLSPFFNAKNAAVSPDGTKVALLCTGKHMAHSTIFKLLLADWSDGALQAPRVLVDEVRAEAKSSNGRRFCGLFTRLLEVYWFGNNTILMNVNVGCRRSIAAIDLTGAVSLVEVSDIDQTQDGSLSVAAVCNGRAVVASSSPVSPPQLYYTTDLLAFVPFAAPQPSPYQRHSTLDISTLCSGIEWSIGHAGAAGEYILLRPRAAPGPLPGFVFPHGGPHGAYVAEFSAFLLAHVCAGFAVAQLNYPGSIGFGQDFLERLPGHVGTVDVEGCKAMVDVLINTGVFDKERVVVCGGSHGGFLTAHLSAQYPEAFRAAILLNPVINIASMADTTDIPDWCYYESSKVDYYETPVQDAAVNDQMFRSSPLFHVRNVKCPSLILVGADDLRVPPSQGKTWARALTKLNKKAHIKVYSENCHPLAGAQAAADVFVSSLLFARWATA